MKWFSFSYVKQKPWLFVAIVLIFGTIFWLLFNRGASASQSGVVTAGKSDAQIAAEAQLGMAQIQAGIAAGQTAAQLAAIQSQGDIAIALATMETAFKTQQLAVQRDIADAGIAAQIHAMDIAYQQSVNNNAFQLDYATLAFDAAIQQSQINAQIATQSMLFSAISSLKSKDRDDTLERIFGNPEVIAIHNPATTQTGSGFSFPVFGAIGSAIL